MKETYVQYHYIEKEGRVGTTARTKKLAPAMAGTRGRPTLEEHSRHMGERSLRR